MKKRFVALALALLCICLTSCANEKESNVSEAFSPLFRFSADASKSNQTRFFYLEESDGFVYIHPKEGGGFLGGFVSPERSVSSESIIEGEGELAFASLREKEKDRATVLTPDGVRLALLKENSADFTPMKEDVSFSAGIFYDDLTLLGETEDLLLLCPVDFSESYVLAQKARLPDFAEPIAVTHEKTRIWYSLKGEDGSFGGISFFEYGKNTPMGTENFSFDAVQSVGDGKLLFTRLTDDGGALYLYRDLEENEGASLVADTPFDSIICDPDGEIFCGIRNENNKGEVFIYDFQKGTEKGSFPAAANLVSAMAIDDDGENLLIAICAENDEILGTLDLTYFR